MTGVLFWDIDGTLLTTGWAGLFAWEAALRVSLGVEQDLSEMKTSGMTDVEIAHMLIGLHGGGEEAKLQSMVRAYEESLPGSLPKREGYVLPGVQAVLEAVHGRDDIRSMLLTGNTRAGADAKLTYYGLAGYFEGGAFGDDADDRPGVASLAWNAAKRSLGDEFDVERSYVIGDTPADVECGKAIGVRTVAVASGTYGVAELQQTGPWLVLPSIPSPNEFDAALGLAQPQEGRV
jgi:phosphoglycolate phosphatase